MENSDFTFSQRLLLNIKVIERKHNVDSENQILRDSRLQWKNLLIIHDR